MLLSVQEVEFSVVTKRKLALKLYWIIDFAQLIYQIIVIFSGNRFTRPRLNTFVQKCAELNACLILISNTKCPFKSKPLLPSSNDKC